MGYRLFLWDFDGTLADTLGRLLRIYNGLAARHGFRSVEDPEAVRGLTLPAFLRSHGIPLGKLPSLVREVLAAQKDGMAAVRLFPALPRVLHNVCQAGRRMGVLSSNAEGNIRACLCANAVEGLFESVVGYRRLFGKGRAIRRFLTGQDMAADEVVYVGDEVRDIEAARQAGVKVAAVTWGLHTRQLLDGHAPDHLLERPEQLLELLD